MRWVNSSTQILMDWSQRVVFSLKVVLDEKLIQNFRGNASWLKGNSSRFELISPGFASLWKMVALNWSEKRKCATKRVNGIRTPPSPPKKKEIPPQIMILSMLPWGLILLLLSQWAIVFCQLRRNIIRLNVSGTQVREPFETIHLCGHNVETRPIAAAAAAG